MTVDGQCRTRSGILNSIYDICSSDAMAADVDLVMLTEGRISARTVEWLHTVLDSETSGARAYVMKSSSASANRDNKTPVPLPPTVDIGQLMSYSGIIDYHPAEFGRAAWDCHDSFVSTMYNARGIYETSDSRPELLALPLLP